MQVKSYLCPVH